MQINCPITKNIEFYIDNVDWMDKISMLYLNGYVVGALVGNMVWPY